MTSLAKCLEIHKDKLSDYEISQIKKAVKGYHADGIKGSQANVSAVEDLVSDLEKEQENILRQAGSGKVAIPKKIEETSKEEDVEIKTVKGEKIVTTDLTKKEEDNLTLKEQKEYLLAEIDKAIEAAPDVEQGFVKEEKPEGETKLSLNQSIPAKSISPMQMEVAMRTIVSALNEVLPESISNKVQVEVKPYLVPKAHDAIKSLKQYGFEGNAEELQHILDSIKGNIKGLATLFGKMNALIQVAYRTDSSAMEETAYHEAFHVVTRWLLPNEEYTQLMEHFKGNEEDAAIAFAKWAMDRKTAIKENPSWLNKLFAKLREIFNAVRNALAKKGFTSPEQIFQRIMDKEFRRLVSEEEVQRRAKGPALQVAYHGTPHKWTPEPGFPHGRPRLDKIGTGEGAQAYGWGWYSAEAEGTAKSYQHTGSNVPIYLNLKRYQLAKGAFNETGSIKDAKTLLNERAKSAKSDAARQQYYDAINNIETLLNEPQGSLYTIDIPDDVMPKLLDWDKPLSEQSEYVKAILKNIRETDKITNKTFKGWFDDLIKRDKEGESLYHLLSSQIAASKGGDVFKGDDRGASELLSSLGIPGQKYLDQVSRGLKGGGSRNYVIWDQPTLYRVKILERNKEKLTEPETMLSLAENDDVWAERFIRNSIKDPKERAKARKASEQAGEELIDNASGMLTFNVVKDTTVRDRTFKTPLHYFSKIPSMWRSFKSVNRKDENKKSVEDYINNNSDGTSRIGNLGVFEKENSVEYKRYQEALIKNDRNQYGYRVKFNSETNSWDLYSPGEKKIAEGLTEKELEENIDKNLKNKAIRDLVLTAWNEQTRKFEAYVPEGGVVESFPDSESAWRSVRREENGKWVGREVDDWIDLGFSEPALQSIFGGKGLTDQGFKLRHSNITKLVSYYEKNGLPLPYRDIEIGGKKVKVTLKDYLSKMGDLRGYYFPRIRRSGQYELKAHNPKTGERHIEFFDVAIENLNESKLKNLVNSSLPIGRKARELKKRGFVIEAIERSSSTPEDVFEMAGSVIAMNDKIMAAIDAIDKKDYDFDDFGLKASEKNGDIKVEGPISKFHKEVFNKYGGQYYDKAWHFKNKPERFKDQLLRALSNVSNMVDRESVDLFTHHLLEEMSNIDKGRGFRQHMIQRQRSRGTSVWRGYEENPVLAYATYTNSISGGESKRQMAMEIIRYWTGTDISWDDFKEIISYDGTYDEYIESRPKPKGPIDMPPISREDFEAINDPEAIEKNKEDIERLKGSGDKEGILEARNFLWNKYKDLVKERRIDSRRQKNAFHDMKVFTQDVLRNDEFIDRIVGNLKGLAVLKYLGFRVFSAPLVNLTALPTATVASMNIYGDIPINLASSQIIKMIPTYVRYKTGKPVGKEDKEIFDYIFKKGWHNAQWKREAMNALESRIGRKYTKLMEASMYVFGLSEQMNRAVTISAAYSALKRLNPDMKIDQLMEKAHTISDEAHSVYNKANRPGWVRGSGIAGNVLKSSYMFKSFAHNYFQLIFDAWGPSLTPEHKKALAWLVVSPAMIAGTGAMVGKELLFALVKAFTDSDDPEEDYYDWVNENFGDSASRFARYGVTGLAGVNIKGSLEMGVTDLPTSLPELLGAPYSVISDTFGGVAQMIKGDVWKGAEKVLPLAGGNILKGIREAREGVTTKTNIPVFYGNKPIVADYGDAALRVLSLNPASIAEKREKQWNEKEVVKKYKDEATDIYSRLRKLYIDKDEEGLIKVFADIEEFNKKVYGRRLIYKGVALITKDSIKTNLKKSFMPPKTERLRRE